MCFGLTGAGASKRVFYTTFCATKIVFYTTFCFMMAAPGMMYKIQGTHSELKPAAAHPPWPAGTSLMAPGTCGFRTYEHRCWQHLPANPHDQECPPDAHARCRGYRSWWPGSCWGPAALWVTPCPWKSSGTAPLWKVNADQLGSLCQGPDIRQATAWHPSFITTSQNSFVSSQILIANPTGPPQDQLHTQSTICVKYPGAGGRLQLNTHAPTDVALNEVAL